MIRGKHWGKQIKQLASFIFFHMLNEVNKSLI